MSTEHPNAEATISKQERLRLATAEYHDAMYAADTPASGMNFSLRQWQDVTNVHNMIHFDKQYCPGPPQEAAALDSPPPCDLAGLEQASKERVMNCMEHLLGQGWAISFTIERAVAGA